MDVLNPEVYAKKWKSFPKILALLVLAIVIIAGAMVFGFWLAKKSAPPAQLEVVIPVAPPKVTEETLKPGEIGEIPEAEGLQAPSGALELPPVVFNTTGKILEIQKDRLIVEGSGSNFADQKPRNLTVIFSSSTITFEPGQKIQYQGLEGLKHLKIGAEILIEGVENIRGKTEFIANTINIL